MVEKKWQPDAPAFLNYTPDELAWVPCDEVTLQTQLQRFFLDFGVEAEGFRLFQSTQHPKRFFKVSTSAHNYFLKVIHPSQFHRESQLSPIVEYLGQNNINVIHLEFSINLASGARIQGYLLLEGRYLSASESDCRLLGRELGKLHRVLLQYPSQDIIKERGLLRFEAQKKMLERIHCSDVLHSQLSPSLLNCLLHYSLDSYDCLIENARPIHGDLNLGNMLVCQQSKLYFLDWEEAPSAWFSPFMDVAFVIERLLLVENHCDAEMRACDVLYQYCVALDIEDLTLDLSQILQAMAIRALLILIDNTKETKTVSIEWKKFVALYKLAESNKKLLNRVTCQVQKRLASHQ